MRYLFLAFFVLLSFSINAQSLDDELIKLARIYRNFHFTNQPLPETFLPFELMGCPSLSF